MSREANLRKAVRLTAKIPTIVAAFHRMRGGQRVVKPNAKYATAKDYLRLITGLKPDNGAARIMDMALILHGDETMNAGSCGPTVASRALPALHTVTGGADE